MQQLICKCGARYLLLRVGVELFNWIGLLIRQSSSRVFIQPDQVRQVKNGKTLRVRIPSVISILK